MGNLGFIDCVLNWLPEQSRQSAWVGGQILFEVRSSSIAVYAYRRGYGNLEFLQLLRSEKEESYGSTWQPIYGAANDGELAADAARRELFEETGLKPLQLFLVEHIESLFFRPDNAVLLLPVFAAQLAVDSKIKLNEEHSDFRWVPEADVKSKFIWRSQRQALQVIIETLKDYPESIPRLLV